MDQQPVISDNVVRKIQLLLQLAERTEGNEVEAAAAMAKAQDLLAQYNLDLATVQEKAVAGGTNTPEDAMAKRDYAKGSRSALYRWQRELVKTLAEANYCHYWHVKEMCGTPLRLRNRHKVLGRVANTTTVLIMVDYLFSTIERLLPEEYAALGRRSTEASLWREGCAERLGERIREKAEAMRKADYATQGEAGYSNAIAIRNMAAAEEAGNYDVLYGKGAWARKLKSEADWEAGREAREARWELEATQRQEREAKELAELEAKLALETPDQKARRLRKEAQADARHARANNRYWDAQDRKDDRERERRSSGAFHAGRRTAEKVGLDSQVGAGSKRKEIA